MCTISPDNENEQSGGEVVKKLPDTGGGGHFFCAMGRKRGWSFSGKILINLTTLSA
jgi:hypothetical protein